MNSRDDRTADDRLDRSLQALRDVEVPDALARQALARLDAPERARRPAPRAAWFTAVLYLAPVAPEGRGQHRGDAVVVEGLGRVITYQPVGLLAYRRDLVAEGLPSAFVNVQLLINVVARLGLAARVDDTLPRLLGRPPLTLQQYIEDHRDLWRRA